MATHRLAAADYETVICCETDVPRYVAVKVLVPALIPVTTPAPETVATAGLSLLQLTALVTSRDVELPARMTPAVYCDVLPTAGGFPLIVSELTTADGNDVLLLHPALLHAPASAALNKQTVNDRRIIALG